MDGVYAYLAICTLSIAELFPNEWNEDFNKQYVKALCSHLGASESIKTVMLVLVEGESGQDPELYVDLLLKEPTLANKAILVVQDVVLFAVRKGKKIWQNFCFCGYTKRSSSLAKQKFLFCFICFYFNKSRIFHRKRNLKILFLF